jgi:replicative DNA helicase
MKDQLPPYDLQAEEALIGAMILNNEAIGEVLPLCSAEDLYTPRLKVLYSTMAGMHGRGEPVDATTLSGALTLSESEPVATAAADIMGLIANAGFVSNVSAYATRVVKCAAYRKLISACHEIGDRAFSQDGDPSELGDMLNAAVLDIHKSDVVEVPGDVWTIDGFLDRPVSERPAWVIPGLMRVGGG